jgi:hypothetical protein
MPSLATLRRARVLLCQLQDHIRDALIGARPSQSARFARVAGVTAADTIYHIDRISAIVDWFERRWPRAWPVEIVMEGLEDHETATFPRGTPVRRTEWKCILDPIDGTRGLMYDKRSAWSLAGLAVQRGARTSLSDILVAAQTELPTTKQWRADQISAVRGQGRRGLSAHWIDVRSGSRGRWTPQPSRARDFKHGFSSFAKFFPDGKRLLAAWEESFWSGLHRKDKAGLPVVFDDQYISTGGQLYELLVGHDRLVADLRPLAFRRLGLESALVCHPYDICTELVLTEAGGVVEAPDGRKLAAPLDTTSAVSWVGFANAHLARLARPLLRRAFKSGS